MSEPCPAQLWTGTRLLSCVLPYPHPLYPHTADGNDWTGTETPGDT